MEKRIKSFMLFVVALVLLFGFGKRANAMTREEFDDLDSIQMYVVGDYIFDLSTYNPTIRDLMTAARTIQDDEVEIIEVWKNGDELQATGVFDQETVSSAKLFTNYINNVSKLVKSSEGQRTVENYSYSVKFYIDDDLYTSLTVGSGLTATRPEKDPSGRDGYTFSEWLLNNETYEFSTPVVSNIDLLAAWSLNTYDVVFDDNVINEEITVPASVVKTFGTNLDISETTDPEREGYEFLGWAVDDEATTADFTTSINRDLTVGTADQTLYAVWKLLTYNITYNVNTGDESSTPQGQTKNYGFNIALTETEPTKTGYTFLEWNTESDGSGTSYDAGDSYTGNAVLTLYAQWEINTYDITYHINGGFLGSTPSSQSKTYNIPVTLNLYVYPSNSGYAFVKWNTQADGEGTDYYPGDNYTVDADLNLFAVWAEAVQVRFEANAQEYTLDTAKNMIINTSRVLNYEQMTTLTGYKFDGWFKVLSSMDSRCMDEHGWHLDFGQYGEGEDTYYCFNGDVLMQFNILTDIVTEGITLKGHFSEGIYVVSYDLNNGTDETLNDDEITRSETIALPDISSQTIPKDALNNNATFMGWSTQANECSFEDSNICLTGTMDDALMLDGFNVSEDITLYALWDYNAVTVEYYTVSNFNYDTWDDVKVYSDTLEKDHLYTFRAGDNVQYSEDVTFDDYAEANNLVFLGWSIFPEFYGDIENFSAGESITLDSVNSENALLGTVVKLYPIFVYDEMIVHFDIENPYGSTVVGGGEISDTTVNFGGPLELPEQLLSDSDPSFGYIWAGWESDTDVFGSSFSAEKHIIEVEDVEINDSTIPVFCFGIVYVDHADEMGPTNEVTLSPKYIPSWYLDLIDSSKPEYNSVNIDGKDDLIGMEQVISDLGDVEKNITFTINTPMYDPVQSEFSMLISGIYIPSNVTVIMGQYNNTNLRFQTNTQTTVDGTLVVHQETLLNNRRGSFDIFTGYLEGPGNITINYGGTFKVITASATEEFIGNTDNSTLKMIDVCLADDECFNTNVVLKFDNMAHSVRIDRGTVEINDPNFGILDDAFVIQNPEVYVIGEGATLVSNVTTVIDGSVEGSGTFDLANGVHVYLGDYGGSSRFTGNIEFGIIEAMDTEDLERIHYPQVTVSFSTDGIEGITNMPDPASAVFTSGDNYTVPNNIPVRSDYQFLGWVIAGEDNVYCNAGETLHGVTESITLQPKWQSLAGTFSITYDMNGLEWTTFPPNEVGIPPEEGRNASYITPVLLGYEFLGWATTPDGAAQYGVSADLGSISQNIVLYAKYQVEVTP